MDIQNDLIERLVTAGMGRSNVLSPRECALLDYADRLTLEPASITSRHVQQLRDIGLDDRAIHDACAIVAYFAFVNRIADGLGVELEDETPR